MGEAPGPMPLAFGRVPVQLVIAAPGYESAKLAVVPDQAQSATVTMKKRSAPPFVEFRCDEGRRAHPA